MRQVLVGVLASLSAVVASPARGPGRLVVAQARPPRAEGDVLVLVGGKLLRGRLLRCDPQACTIEVAGGSAGSVPRRIIDWIGLGVEPPPPAVRDPAHDEVHLRRGTVEVGRLVEIDAARVRTDAATNERANVAWVHLVPLLSGGAPGSSPTAKPGEYCVFWVGRAGLQIRRTERGARTQEVLIRQTMALRFVEDTLGGAAPGLEVRLQDAGSTVWLRLRSHLGGPGGNVCQGEGRARLVPDRPQGELTPSKVQPPGPGQYRLELTPLNEPYPEQCHWSDGKESTGRNPFLLFSAGAGEDPVQPRILEQSGTVMQGDYDRTEPSGRGLRRTAAGWGLQRVKSACDAPPPMPPMPDQIPDTPDEWPPLDSYQEGKPYGIPRGRTMPVEGQSR